MPNSYYILSRRDFRLWNHCNPDLARWHQGRIMARLSASAGDEIYIYDAQENLLAWVCQGETARRMAGE